MTQYSPLERHLKQVGEQWLAEQVKRLRAEGNHAAAERAIAYHGQPRCWQCEVIDGHGSCRCPIAANE